MKIVAVLLMVIYAANAARIRRQDNGDFWWLQTDPPVDLVTNPPEETRIVNTNHGGAHAAEHGVAESYPGGNLNNNPALDDSSYTPDCCVPYYLCKDGNIITDGEGLIDIR